MIWKQTERQSHPPQTGCSTYVHRHLVDLCKEGNDISTTFRWDRSCRPPVTALTGRVILLDVCCEIRMSKMYTSCAANTPRRILTSSTVTKLIATETGLSWGFEQQVDLSTYHPCVRNDHFELRVSQCEVISTWKNPHLRPVYNHEISRYSTVMSTTTDLFGASSSHETT